MTQLHITNIVPFTEGFLIRGGFSKEDRELFVETAQSKITDKQMDNFAMGLDLWMEHLMGADLYNETTLESRIAAENHREQAYAGIRSVLADVRKYKHKAAIGRICSSATGT